MTDGNFHTQEVGHKGFKRLFLQFDNKAIQTTWRIADLSCKTLIVNKMNLLWTDDAGQLLEKTDFVQENPS